MKSSLGTGFDDLTMASLRDAFEQNLRASAEALEATGRQWQDLNAQLIAAHSELDRLRSIQAEHSRLVGLYDDELEAHARLRSDHDRLRASEAAANERAAKFEEICEQVKERAMEIHTAFQQTRASEQDALAEVERLKGELTELGRNLQDEGLARIAAEDRAQKLISQVEALEAVENEARDRVARLVQDNRNAATQNQQLTADRDSWQKQFQASERENARMQSERRAAAERTGELEDEIRTLRADLASITSTLQAEEASAGVESDDNELDLAGSLERAFAQDDDEAPATTKGRRSH